MCNMLITVNGFIFKGKLLTWMWSEEKGGGFSKISLKYNLILGLRQIL